MFTQANVSFSAQWGTGLIGQMRVSNDSQLLNNWTITFDVPFQIVNLWDATILTATNLGGGMIRYTVGSAGWNASVPPGGGVSFVFEGRAESNIQAQLTGVTFGSTEALAVPPAVTISDAVLAEGASGTKEMVFTVSLSKPATETVTVPWSTQDGTALAGSDYNAASGSLTFAPGETSKTISVTIRGDAAVEANETFNLLLGMPLGATTADGTALGTIQNDDVLPSLSIADAQVSEGNAGTRLMVFTVTLSAAAQGPVTVAYTTRDGTALAGTDYNAQSGSLSFAAGETSKTIAVEIRGDTVDEIDESFEIALSGLTAASFARSSAIGVIANDDAPPVLSVSNAEVVEGNSGTRSVVFTLSLSQAIAQSVSANFATQDGTALAGSDYVARSGSVTFAAGETSKTVSVTVNGDTAIEADETFGLVLSNVARATLAPGGGTGTIRNDDLPPPTLAISDAQVTEGDAGTKQMLFTVTLSRAISSTASVTWATQNGTAASGSDYTGARGTLSFAAGEVSKTIAVAVRGDTAVEANETFSVVLGTATRATIADGTGLGTILNDDVPPTLTISDAQVTEGDAGTKQMLFTVTLSRAISSTASVTWTTQAGTATAGTDFTAASGTLSFAAGEVSKTIAVTLRGDTAVEADENFSVVLGTATRATIADGTATGTILNDDQPPPTLAISDAQVTEGDAGTKQMLFTVSLSRAATGAVSVNYATQAGTATAGSDFVAASGTLNFAAGEISKTIAVTINGDTAVEANESFNLLLSGAAGATIADGTGLGTIQNDDVLPTLAIADAQIAEGNAGVTQMLFTVTLSRAMGGPVTVSYATQAGTATAGADFTAATGTLSFAAGETSKTIAVAVNGDTAVEANEGFNLLLSAANGATITDGTALGTILNDDVSAPPPSGDTATFRVTERWNGGFLAEITVVNDATPIEGGWTLAFDAPFQIKGVWNAEIVSQSGSSYVIRNAPWNGNIGPLGTTTFGIDVAGSGEPVNFSVNGAAPAPVLPGLSIADAFLTEGDAGSALMNFTVSLSAAAAEAVTVQYGTANGSALAGLDYQALSGSLTFAPGEVSKVLSVAILGDTLREGTESFALNLTAPTGARLADGAALGSIRDNDAPASTLPPPGWYSTSGNQIIDSTGEAVRLKGINWFGMEGYLGVPDGLYTRNWQDMMEQMRELGFDTIRLPFSLQNIQPGAMPNNIVYSLNPDLVGLSNLQVLDKIVDYAGDLGMKIILDCHRSSSGAGPNENGLWYDQNFSEAQWISSWKSLVQRYVDDSTVIGVDLQNEPHGATWTDWSAAAERAGNAIHEVNPNLLIVVEGVGNYQGDYYWWGGQLEGVRDDPVVLQQANKLVYSPHDYPNSIYPNSWFEGPNFKDNLPNVFREHWGFIYEEGIAPIFLGEFGSKLTDSRDIAWLDELTQYLNGDFDTDGVLDIAPGEEGMSFAYWSWNPNSTDTGGILKDDWISVHQHKMAALESILIG
ncbi:Calx-beta domain-containing protein [Sediminicoccus rosea]|uniref:cellulase n=1 Tax=Sediminicoccus rosea TaxID=1225128 RepID=A0ABZ0PJK3_9PROT|nr:Calx-beta domain-containing protein [Sediminicoccus rosea]WPB85657.1 Calx-beta domain-containing protein [Sediminicoccus rosea]